MLQVKYIKENKKEVIQRLAIKNFEGKEIIEEVLKHDENRKIYQQQQSHHHKLIYLGQLQLIMWE